MTGTNIGLSVDIGAGFDEDGDDISMAIQSGLHKGGIAILHSRHTIRYDAERWHTYTVYSSQQHVGGHK